MIGEGGSGGALALGGLGPRADAGERDLLGDHAGGLRDDPLARSASEKKKAAAAFKPDAFHCLELGVIDAIVSEPRGGAQEDPDEAAASLKSALVELARRGFRTLAPGELRRSRRAKFRAMGVYA